MSNVVLRVVVNAIALWAAAGLIGGITLSDRFVSVLLVSAIFGAVNAVLKPIAVALSFPVIFVTLGLFMLVINALLLQLTDWFSGSLEVDGFTSAVLGSIVISIVSWSLSFLVPDK